MRVRDGAKLIVSASQSGNGYVADNDGVTYTVSAKSLVISVGNKVIREEPMVDSHTPGTPSAPTGTSAPTAPKPTTPTPTTPLPPPLPAELGGGS